MADGGTTDHDLGSIKSVARTLAHGMMNYYHGNETGGTPGLIEGYYWWEVGGMMGALINYWHCKSCHHRML